MTSPRALGGDAVTSLGKAVHSGGGRACADTGPGALRLRPAPRRRAKGVRLLSTVFRLEGRTLQNGEPRGTCAERALRPGPPRCGPRPCGAARRVRRRLPGRGPPALPLGRCSRGCRGFPGHPWSFDFVCFLFKEELYIFIRAEVAF